MADRILQRQIFAGCRQLGIDSETRHDLQLVVTGKESMSDMTDADLRKMIEALKERGFEAGFNRGSKRPRHKLAPRADLRLVHVLWKKLGEANKLDRPGRDGLNAFIRSRFEGTWQSVPIDVDALRDPQKINAVIRALKNMCARNGISLK